MTEEELYNMSTTLAKYISLGLKEFNSYSVGIPGCLLSPSYSYMTDKKAKRRHHRAMEKKWHRILEDMIFAFDYAIEGADSFTDHSTDEHKRYKKGMRLFSKHFLHLWF